MAEPLPIGKALFSQDRRALPSPSNRNQRDNISLEVPFGPSSAKGTKFCIPSTVRTGQIVSIYQLGMTYKNKQ